MYVVEERRPDTIDRQIASEHHNAPVAQLDRASACGAGSHRFESCQAHHPLSFNVVEL